MSVALRVLLVDDSETDAKLVSDTLRAAGYDVAAERVEKADSAPHTARYGRNCR